MESPSLQGLVSESQIQKPRNREIESGTSWTPKLKKTFGYLAICIYIYIYLGPCHKSIMSQRIFGYFGKGRRYCMSVCVCVRAGMDGHRRGRGRVGAGLLSRRYLFKGYLNGNTNLGSRHFDICLTRTCQNTGTTQTGDFLLIFPEKSNYPQTTHSHLESHGLPLSSNSTETKRVGIRMELTSFFWLLLTAG